MVRSKECLKILSYHQRCILNKLLYFYSDLDDDNRQGVCDNNFSFVRLVSDPREDESDGIDFSGQCVECQVRSRKVFSDDFAVESSRVCPFQLFVSCQR